MPDPKQGIEMVNARTPDDRPDGAEWTEDRIEEMVNEQWNDWADRKGDDVRRMDLYRGTHSTEVPDKNDADVIVDPKIVKTKRGKEIIDLFTGVLAVRVQYSINSLGVGRDANLIAEQATRWLNTVEQTMEYQHGEDYNYMTTQDTLIYGYSARKTMPDPSVWAHYPVQGEAPAREFNQAVEEWTENAPLPIVSYHIPTPGWIPILHNRNVLVSIEKNEVTAAWIRAKFPDAILGTNLKPNDKVQFVEIMDDTWVGYYVWQPRGDGKQQAVPLKFLRHGVELAGPKRAPVAIYECYKTSSMEPKWRWSGLLEAVSNPTDPDVDGLLELEDFSLTRLATMVRAFYQPTVILELAQTWSTQAMEQAAAGRQFTIGGTNFVFKGADGNGENFRLFELPGNLPDNNLLHSVVTDRLDRYMPPTLQGQSSAGDSGYKVNRDTENAEKKLSKVADNMARGDADTGRFWFRAVKAFGEAIHDEDAKVYLRYTDGEGTRPVWVNWPMVKDYGPMIQALRKDMFDLDWGVAADTASKLLSDPINMSRKTVMKDILRIDNPQEEDDEKWFEDLERDPRFSEREIEAIMLGLVDLEIAEQGVSPEEVLTRVDGGEPLAPGVEEAVRSFKAPVAGGRPGAQVDLSSSNPPPANVSGAI